MTTTPRAVGTAAEIAELADKLQTSAYDKYMPAASHELEDAAIALRAYATLLTKQAEWTLDRPAAAGLYRVRGWSLDYPPAEAVVSVRRFKGDLVCNIHRETTNRDLKDWCKVEFLTAPTFEWQRIDAAMDIAKEPSP